MRRRAVLVAAMGLVLTGCSTTIITGSPAETALTKAELYDPCTLPATSLQALGLDPKPIDRDFIGVPDPEWHLCLWDSSPFDLTVLSTTHTFREVKENPRNEEPRDVIIAGRQSFTYFDVSDVSRFECNVAFATEAGVVIVRSRIDEFVKNRQDPCVVARASATSLNGDFPQ